MKYRAIIWDLDGTLIYFNIDWMRCRREAIKILKTYDVPKKYLNERESIIDTVRKSRDYLLENGMHQEKIQEIIKAVDLRVIDVELEAAVEARATDGIEEVLKYIENLGLKQAVCTLNTENNAVVSLESAKLSHYFQFIAGRDSLQNSKPHPDHIELICKKLGVDVSEIIIIGDTHRDIRTALAVDAISIGLETKMSYVTAPENIEFFNKADYKVKEEEIPDKLIEILKELIEK